MAPVATSENLPGDQTRRRFFFFEQSFTKPQTRMFFPLIQLASLVTRIIPRSGKQASLKVPKFKPTWVYIRPKDFYLEVYTNNMT